VVREENRRKLGGGSRCRDDASGYALSSRADGDGAGLDDDGRFGGGVAAADEAHGDVPN
jgi:hypothetical protein